QDLLRHVILSFASLSIARFPADFFKKILRTGGQPSHPHPPLHLGAGHPLLLISKSAPRRIPVAMMSLKYVSYLMLSSSKAAINFRVVSSSATLRFFFFLPAHL